METNCLVTETLSVYALVVCLGISGLLAGTVAAWALSILGLYHGALFLNPTIPSSLIPYAFVQLCFFASTLVVIRAFLRGKIFAYRCHFGLLAVVVLVNIVTALFMLVLAGVLDIPEIADAFRRVLFEYMQHVYNACCAASGFGLGIPDCSEVLSPTELCIANEFNLESWVSSSTCELVSSFDPGLIGNSSGALQACGGGNASGFLLRADRALKASIFPVAIVTSVLAAMTVLVLLMSICIHCCAKVDEAVEKRAKKKRTFRALSKLRMDQELGRRVSANVAAKLPPPPGMFRTSQYLALSSS